VIAHSHVRRFGRTLARSRLGRVAVVAALAAFVPLVPVEAAVPVPGGIAVSAFSQGGPLPPLTSGGTVTGPVTFYGRGYGHGVGMSQYGARGRALAGQSAETILAHYYSGTTLGSVDPATPVRVLVLAGFAPTATSPLVLHGRSGSWSVDGIAGAWPADAKLTVTPTTVAGSATWRLTVTSVAGQQLGTATTCCSIRVRPQQSSTRLQVDSKPSLYDTYRGLVRIYGSATKVSVVDEVGLDLYLRGVVPSEMPYTWPVQALRAQSIAARSYAVNHRHPSTGSYDFRDDTSAQVYHGVKGEKSATTTVVDGDPGRVLRYGTAVANAMFHSAGGGATENNEDAFPSSSGTLVASPVAYLRGSSDRMPDGTPYDAASPYASWHTATYTVAQLSSYFARDVRTNVGTLTRIDLSHRGVSGRLYRVTLTGSLGTKSVSGDVFRSVFNAWSPAADPPLRSNLFDLRPIP
jgi:stage II sporulation protein D